MIVGHFLLDANEANAYILGCEETGDAALIDVGAFDKRFEPFCVEQGLRIKTIIITHDHWDHTGGLGDAMRCFDAEAFSFSGNAGGIATKKLAPGGAVHVGKLSGRVVHTPGHTPDGISLIFDGAAFSGDALFCGSVGGTGTKADYDRQIAAIREHLFSLPDTYEVYSGHGPLTTIGIEKKHNPFFV